MNPFELLKGLPKERILREHSFPIAAIKTITHQTNPPNPRKSASISDNPMPKLNSSNNSYTSHLRLVRLSQEAFQTCREMVFPIGIISFPRISDRHIVHLMDTHGL